jgi:chromosome segregation ATPase
MESYIKLTESLMELPRAIKEIQLQILNKNEEQQKISSEITRLEAKIKADINAATDANGKKLYSNAEMREAELVERASNDSEITSLKEKHEAILREISEDRLEVEMLSNTQRNTRTLLEFFSAFNDRLQ